MSATVLPWPIKPAPRFKAPLQGGKHTACCSVCHNDAFRLHFVGAGEIGITCHTCGALQYVVPESGSDVDGAA